MRSWVSQHRQRAERLASTQQRRSGLPGRRQSDPAGGVQRLDAHMVGTAVQVLADAPVDGVRVAPTDDGVHETRLPGVLDRYEVRVAASGHGQLCKGFHVLAREAGLAQTGRTLPGPATVGPMGVAVSMPSR